MVQLGKEGGGDGGQTHKLEKKRWQNVKGNMRAKVSQQQRRSHQFHEVVSQCVENMTNRSQDDEAANAITQVRQAIKQVAWPIKPAAVLSLETQTCFVKNRRKSQVCVSNNRHILILLNARFARQKMPLRYNYH